MLVRGLLDRHDLNRMQLFAANLKTPGDLHEARANKEEWRETMRERFELWVSWSPSLRSCLTLPSRSTLSQWMTRRLLWRCSDSRSPLLPPLALTATDCLHVRSTSL